MLKLLRTCPVLRWHPKWQPFTLNSTYFDTTVIHADDIGNKMYKHIKTRCSPNGT